MATSTSTTNPQQVAQLLQSLLSKGITTQDALPTIKYLVQAKIFSLDDITLTTNLPKEISSKVRSKLLSINKSKKKKRQSSSSSSSTLLSATTTTTATATTSTSDTSNNNNNNNNKKRRCTIQNHSESIVIPTMTITSPRPIEIKINRSPVLTLWASIVSQILFSLSWEEALTVGSAFATITAKGKGRSLGIYTTATTTTPNNNNDDDDDDDSAQKQSSGENTPIKEEEEKKKKGPSPSTLHVDNMTTEDITSFSLMGQLIRVRRTSSGIRALSVPSTGSGSGSKEERELLDPSWIWNHLQNKFTTGLPYVIKLFQDAVAKAVVAGGQEGKEVLESTAYQYYMYIRPDIPHGRKGWGAYGMLQTHRLQEFYPLPPSSATSSSSQP